MKLKEIIRYTNAVALEATWVEEAAQPTKFAEEVVVKCHAYSGNQMDMLRAELSAEELVTYKDMIDQCEADWVPPAPIQLTPEQIEAEVVGSTQLRLDNFAHTRNYDNMLSACTYATSDIEKFRIEGQYCVSVRDLTWAKLYEIMAEVEAGTRDFPSGFADIEAELPALVWPE